MSGNYWKDIQLHSLNEIVYLTFSIDFSNAIILEYNRYLSSFRNE